MPDDRQDPPDDDRNTISMESLPKHTRPTRKLSHEEIMSGGNMDHAIAMAALERLAPWAIYAFRLGCLTLLQKATREMVLPGAKSEQIVKSRELIEMLAKLPGWEP